MKAIISNPVFLGLATATGLIIGYAIVNAICNAVAGVST